MKKDEYSKWLFSKEIQSVGEEKRITWALEVKSKLESRQQIILKLSEILKTNTCTSRTKSTRLHYSSKVTHF